MGPSRVGRRNEAQAARSAEFLVVALFHTHVDLEDRRPTVLRRKAAFVHFDIFDGVWIEGAEKTEQVVCVIHDGFVRHDQVLVAAAAAYKQAGGAFEPAAMPGLSCRILIASVSPNKAGAAPLLWCRWWLPTSRCSFFHQCIGFDDDLVEQGAYRLQGNV